MLFKTIMVFQHGRVLLNTRSSDLKEHINELGYAVVRMEITTGDCLVAVHSEINLVLEGSR